MHTRLVKRVVALMAAMTLVASCGGDDNGEDGSTSAPSTPAADSSAAATGGSATTDSAPDASDAGDEPEPVMGGSLTVLQAVESRGLDPVMSAVQMTVQGDSLQQVAVFGTLMYQEPVAGEVIFDLAESMTSDDGVTWTLKLKPSLVFSDGTPLDAAAVKYNWERHADPDLASTAMALAQTIASMEVSDDTTLVVTLKEPSGQFPRSIAAKALTLVGSPTAIEAEGDGFSSAPVGAGPFVVKEWVRDSQLVLERNPTYYDAPRPYLDELIIKVVPDADQRFSTFMAGQADLTVRASPQEAEIAESAGHLVVQLQPTGGQTLNFNLTKPPFDDIRARQAVGYALDFGKHADVVLRGSSVAMSYLFPEDSPFFDPDAPFIQRDEAQAQALLDELAAETGGPLKFRIMVGDIVASTAEFHQATLMQFDNIDVEVDIRPASEVIPTQRSGDFEIGISGVNMMGDPEPGLYDRWHTGGSQNLMGYSNAEVDAALEIGRVSIDQDERIAAYRTAQELVNADLPELWGETRKLTVIPHTDKVHGVELFADGVIQWPLVWIES